jgi:DNA-binding NarL/FixJ family response regulator
MRIFLVEDNAVAQTQLREALAAIPHAHIVDVARTAADAKRWLAENPDAWDVALIDLFLASGHGFDVLRQCQQRQPGQRAAVFSNYTRDPVREHARRAGADAVFDKSFEIEGLLAWCEQQAEAAPAG